MYYVCQQTKGKDETEEERAARLKMEGIAVSEKCSVACRLHTVLGKNSAVVWGPQL